MTITGGNILYNAFSNCSRLTNVTIGNGVTSIGGSAFYGCTGLTSVTIGGSVTSISKSAFDNCKGLTSIIVGKENTKYHSSGNCLIETTSKTLIFGCKTSVIPSDGSVTSIGDYAFYNCIGLTSITIPNNVTIIGGSAFAGCTGLTSVTIGNSVTSIGENTFSDCKRLTTVNWNATECKSAGSYYSDPIFKGCSNLATVNIGDNVKIIPSYAFSDCKRLTSIIVPDSVTSIGFWAFGGTAWYNNQPDGLVYAGKVAYIYKGTMPSNTSIVLKEGTLGITEAAFSGCTGLTSITIPDSVTSIGKYAFYDCSGLTSITFNGTKAQWYAISKGDCWKYSVPAKEVVCKDGTVSI